MSRIMALAAIVAPCVAVPATAQDSGCILCSTGSSQGNGPNQAAPAAAPAPGTLAARLDAETAEQPLRIEITGDLAFSRLAFTGRGQGGATLDPQSGAKQAYGAMIDLGGASFQGRGVITGTPSRAVRIELPRHVAMTAGNGESAELTDFTTDLPAVPVLGRDGRLEFSFGARLAMTGPIGGTLRGRIPISVDYN